MANAIAAFRTHSFCVPKVGKAVGVSFRNAMTAFAMIFPAELPDKSMFATLVLTSRFRRPALVWSGVAAAFLLHVSVAVGAGSLLNKLPERLVGAVAALLFAVGSVLLWRDSDSEKSAVDLADASEANAGVTDAGVTNAGVTNAGVTDAGFEAEGVSSNRSSSRSSNRSSSRSGVEISQDSPALSVDGVVNKSFRIRTILVTSFVTVGLAEWGDLTQLATASLAADRGDPVGVGVGAYLALLSVAGLAAFLGQSIVRRVPLNVVRRAASVLFALLATWTIFELF